MITRRSVRSAVVALGAAWEDGIKRFEDWLRMSGRSRRTVQLYAAAVSRYAVHGGVPGHLEQPVVTTFLGARRRDVSAAGVNLDAQALRAYQKFLRSSGGSNGVVVRRQRQLYPRLPRPQSLLEVLARITDLIGSGSFPNLRDGVLMWITLECCLRPEELARLSVGCVLKLELYVPGHTQRSAGRYVPVSGALQAALNAYLDRRDAIRVGKGDHLWIRATGRALRGAEAIGYRIRHAGYTSRSLRDTCVHVALSGGAPVPYVAQLLNLADWRGVERHLAMQVEHLRKAVALLRHQNGTSVSAPFSADSRRVGSRAITLDATTLVV